MLTGQNGILNRASEAKEKTEQVKKDENVTINNYEKIINKYVSNLPSTEYTEPYLPNSTFSYKEGDLDIGLVITDSDENEYVWVEVPKSIYKDSNYNINGEPSSADDWEKIEKCLKLYTQDYSDSSYSDKNATKLERYIKMLRSLYENGGFWIGRYEAGTSMMRTKKEGILDNDKAVIKPDMYPFVYVTRDEAQVLAERMNHEKCTTSLMFGVQWDLTLKYIENKKIEVDQEIKNKLQSEGRTIGNYYDSKFKLNRGKFSQYDLISDWYDFNSEEKQSLVTGSEKQPQTSNSTTVLLTTGATDAARLQNIYDIAGNVWEWTLESLGTDDLCVYRGGSCLNEGKKHSARNRGWDNTDKYNYYFGFRICVWK